MKNPKLYAFYLGGRAPKSNIELHDIVFAVGENVKSLYPKLLELWFGSPERCHIDSWMILDQVEGYDITLSEEPQDAQNHLYFINMGAYRPGYFTEFHENKFVVAENENAAKKWALANLMQGMEKIHKDDLYDVDDCIRMDKIDGYYLHLTPSNNKTELMPHNDYHKIPKNIIDQYILDQKR